MRVCIPSAALAVALATGACGGPSSAAPPGHLAIRASSISGGSDRVDLAPDGRVTRGGEPFGTVTAAGRYTDQTGKIILEIDAQGRLGEPGNPRAGTMAGDGTVVWGGDTLLTIAEDGAIGGSGVAELGASLRYDGPPDGRRAAALVLTGILRVARLARALSSAGTPSAGAEAVAHRVCQAIAANDVAAVRAALLTHDELVSITTKEIDRTEYEEHVAEWIDQWSKLSAEAPGVSCVRVKVIKAETLPPSEKRRREIAFAAVVPVFRIGTEERSIDAFPLLLLDVGGGQWKVAVHQ